MGTPLPATFWLETALLALSVLAVWLLVMAIKRTQYRRNYRLWYGPTARRGAASLDGKGRDERRYP
jgi:beta-lactamase regulating signal transducer with metallopeptidase domain